MRDLPRENEIYRHFKGNQYQIVGIAYHSETMEQQVVYRQLYGEGKLFVRPLDMFMSEVDREKYPEVAQQYRFEKVEQAIDPGLMEFLDAETCKEKIEILSRLRPRLTNKMLDIMSSSMDIELKEGSVDDRCDDFIQCLGIRGRFEVDRLRNW